MAFFKRCFFAFVLLATAFGVSGQLTQIVKAEPVVQPVVETGEPKCWPLDVILLVDQSYSMFSPWPLDAPKEDQKPPSDPDNYRFDAANEILDRLIQNRQDECTQAVHRFGMITFGDRPETVLDLVQIDLGEEDNAASWSETYREEIALAAKDRSQQGTDPLKAFMRAQEMLQKAEDLSTPEGYGPRRTVVVLVTDGAPDGVGESSSYMCNMVKTLTDADWSNTAIWGLGLNASKAYLDNDGCAGTIRNDFKTITAGDKKTRKGEFSSLTYNRQAIPSFVSNVVSAEFGHVGISLSCGEVFYVDPYLEQVTFAFFRDKTDLSDPVKLSYMGEQPGQPLYQVSKGEELINLSTAEGMKLVSYKPKLGKEEIIISRPRPGAWRFDIAGLTSKECQSRVIASEEPIKPIVTLISPRSGVPVPVVAESPYRAENKEIPIIIQLRAKDGSPIANETRFPLHINVDWSLPSGKNSLPDGQKPKTIELLPAQGDKWTSDSSVATPYVGDYQLTFNGKTLYGNGEEGNQFFTEQFSYSAKQIDAFSFAIEEPIANARLACNQVSGGAVLPQPLELRVAIHNDKGEKADGKTYILSDLKDAFTASLFDKNGTPIGDTIKLSPSEQTPGIFEAEVSTGTAENLNCGEMQVRIDFTGKYAVDRFTLPQNQQTISITRVPSYGVQGNLLGLVESQTIRLHPTFRDACPSGAVAPVRFDIETRDLDGKLLNPKDLAVSDPSTLYDGKLVAPDGSFSTVVFKLEERAQGFVLSATAGEGINQSGEYRVEIQPDPSAFKADYVPSQAQPIQVSFKREDPFFTTPLACNLCIGFGSLLAAFMLGLTAFGLTGGPGGTLEIIRSNEVSPLLSLPLRRTRWFSTAKNKALEELGIGSISYSKGKPWSDDHKRAVKLSVLSTDGEAIYENDIESDERQAFIGDFDIRYN